MTEYCDKGQPLKDALDYCLEAQNYFVWSNPPWRTRIQNCKRAFDKHVKKCKQCQEAAK